MEAAYLNDLLLLVERYTALKAAFKGYGLQRAKLTDQLSAVMSGSVGTTYLSPEQQQRFRPRAHELEALVTQLRETAAAELRRMTKECERRAAKANGAATGAALDEASLVLLAVPPEADGSWPDGLCGENGTARLTFFANARIRAPHGGSTDRRTDREL